MSSYLSEFFWIKLYNQYLLQCILYCLPRYYKKQTQLVGLFLKKGVLEFVVKILDLYNNKEFLQILWTSSLNWTSSPIFFKNFDLIYYNNSLKYAANRTLFSKTHVKVSTKTEVFLKPNIHWNFPFKAFHEIQFQKHFMKHEILPWNTFVLASKFHCICF